MAYSLEAIITSSKVLDSAKFKNTKLNFGQLSKNYWLLPIEKNNSFEIEKLMIENSLEQDDLEKYKFDFFLPEHLSPWVARFCIELSQPGPVMYCESEYFAGMGGQYGVVWDDKKIAFGPLFTRYNQPNEKFNVNSFSETAINRCIAKIYQSLFVKDGFSVLGLDRFRQTKKWYSEIIEGMAT